MQTSDFDFDLPKRLIAQTPLLRRDASKMLVVYKKTGQISHRRFTDFVEYVHSGDCVVLNDTKVIPGRLKGINSKNAAVEITLIKKRTKNVWEALVKPGRKLREGETASFADGKLSCTILSVSENGLRHIEFSHEGDFFDILREHGKAPLPPYIKETLNDANRYQTVYSKELGSAAAPTAGLHMTRETLRQIEDTGAKTAFLTLHVGLGTFMPVKTAQIEEHKMHGEDFFIEKNAARIINETKTRGKKIIAIGTTSVRALESSATAAGSGSFVKEGAACTNIFIYPGYEFRIPDALFTNFHLPQSTLLMLVCAFAGYELTMEAYKKAVENEYRFFSFGDCMLII